MIIIVVVIVLRAYVEHWQRKFVPFDTARYSAHVVVLRLDAIKSVKKSNERIHAVSHVFRSTKDFFSSNFQHRRQSARNACLRADRSVPAPRTTADLGDVGAGATDPIYINFIYSLHASRLVRGSRCSCADRRRRYVLELLGLCTRLELRSVFARRETSWRQHCYNFFFFLFSNANIVPLRIGSKSSVRTCARTAASTAPILFVQNIGPRG